jgi:AraC-type transcriptional regulator
MQNGLVSHDATYSCAGIGKTCRLVSDAHWTEFPTPAKVRLASSRRKAWQFTTQRMTIQDSWLDNSRQGGSVMAADRFRAGASGNNTAAAQFDAAENEEASQRVGLLAEIPGLLRELGTDPAEIAVSAGLDTDGLDSFENRIPFVAAGRLLHDCAVKTGCQHFALLVGQRARLSHLGLPGQLALHSPTVGAAIRTFAVYQHLNSQGMATFLLEKDGIATIGPVRSGLAILNSAISGNSGQNAWPRKAGQEGVFDGQEIRAAHAPHAHGGVSRPA